MHVIDESKVVISKTVRWIQLSAGLEVFHCQSVMLLFKVCKAQVIVQLGFVLIEVIRLKIRLDRLLVIAHLVKSNSKIEESFMAFALKLIKVIQGLNF